MINNNPSVKSRGADLWYVQYFRQGPSNSLFLHGGEWISEVDWLSVRDFPDEKSAKKALRNAPPLPGTECSHAPGVAGRINVEIPIIIGEPVHSVHSVPEGFASQVLKIVAERGSEYGTPSENHQVTADMLSVWFTRRFGRETKFSAEDVCMIDVLQKASRLAFKSKNDGWMDISGYTENVAQLRPDQRNN